MNFKWTIPGLVSKYSMQAATFLNVEHVTRKMTWPPLVAGTPTQCAVPTFLLTYVPTAVKQTRALRASLFVVVDSLGNIKSVQQAGIACPKCASATSEPEPEPGDENPDTDGPIEDGMDKWDGEMTGLAVAVDKYKVFTCGRPRRGYDKMNFYVHAWNMLDIRVNPGMRNNPAELDEDGKWLPMEPMLEQYRVRVGTSDDGERCSLTWNGETAQLWVTFSSKDTKSVAKAYSVCTQHKISRSLHTSCSCPWPWPWPWPCSCSCTCS